MFKTLIRLIAGPRCTVNGVLPDSTCTPGAIIPDVTLDQICTPGYAKRVRKVSTITKRAVFRSYGIKGTAGYEVDHLIPLELGGSNDIDNLWPEIAPGFHEKDQLENRLHNMVCGGTLNLGDAQYAIAHDWVAAAKKYS